MMKKMLSVLMILALLMPAGALMETAVAPLSGDDFAFVFEGASYVLGGEAAPLVEAIGKSLGKDMEIAEAESALFTGMDRDYVSEGLIVSTYPAGTDGADVIETIMVLVQDYKTPRGAHVGMTLDDIATLYGDDFTLDYDQMIYALEGDTVTLTFAIDTDSDTALCWTLSKNTTK